MPTIINVICNSCKKVHERTLKQVNQVIKNTGYWRCKTCTSVENNKLRAKNIGSKRIHKQKGYVQIKTERGWIKEHTYVIETYIGRRLRAEEAIHHVNEIKTDNRIENLVLMTHGEHTRLHNLKRSKNGISQ
jgi:rubrerythrin